VHARYHVAADGAHSRERAALGIAMRGPDRLREAVTALFRAPLWDLVGERRFGIYAVTHPEAVGSFLPAGPGDRWLYGVSWDPGQDVATRFTEEVLARRIALGAGVPGLRPRIERTGDFTFAAQLADRFRQESAFLVGDAAHRVSPRGGTGMNTSIHDGDDLAWKLAWVLRGWAAEGLLDSYEAERRTAVEHNVARSADPNGSIRETAQELHADLGGRLPHLWLPSPAGRRSTLDLLGPGLTLFTSAHAGAARWAQAAAAVPAPAPPVGVRNLDTVTARALGIRGDGALLVRPDGAPVASWQHSAGAGAALRAAVRSAVGDGDHVEAAA
jgi:putative polyketide hydroxylase